MSKLRHNGYARYNLMQDLYYEGIEFDYKERFWNLEDKISTTHVGVRSVILIDYQQTVVADIDE